MKNFKKPYSRSPVQTPHLIARDESHLEVGAEFLNYLNPLDLS